MNACADCHTEQDNFAVINKKDSSKILFALSWRAASRIKKASILGFPCQSPSLQASITIWIGEYQGKIIYIGLKYSS